MRGKGVSIRFGIGVASLVVLMVIASVVSLYTFREFQTGYEQIAKVSLPTLISAAELAQEANAIASNAPNLVATKRQFSRKAINGRVLDQIESLKHTLKEVAKTNIASTSESSKILIRAAEMNLEQLEAAFVQLDFVVEKRIIADQSFIAALRIARRLSRETHRIIQTGAANTDQKLESGFPIGAMRDIQQRLFVKWASNVQKLTGLLLSLPSEDNSLRLQKIREESVELIEANDKIYFQLSTEYKNTLHAIQKGAAAVVTGSWSIIERREESINLKREQQGILQLNRNNVVRFIASTADLYSHILKETANNSEGFEGLVDTKSNQMLMLVASTMIMGVFIIMYLHWAIIRRINNIKTLMLARIGSRGREIVEEQHDEITEMARVLEFFQEEIEVREKRLRQARDDARQLALEAEAANRSKSAFLANMSHELRTPLNAIIGFSDIIKSGLRPGTDAEYAADINMSGTHLLSVINSVLEFSKIEAGQQNIKPEWADLGRVTESIEGFFKISAKEQNVELKYDFPENSVVWGDEIALKQILVNFISNAIKFSDKGGEILIKGVRGDTLFYLSVSDHGVGIADEEIENVLMPFHQENTEYTKAVGGTGLGLSIVKKQVEQHGGTLTIESKKDVGTTVTATFLLTPPDDLPDTPTSET